MKVKEKQTGKLNHTKVLIALSVAFPPMATVLRMSALRDSVRISIHDATNVNNTAWSYRFLKQSVQTLHIKL